jgi:hypothetical protein
MAETASKRLTVDDARNKGSECRDMAKRVAKSEHRVMLEHMAETWERIALNLSNEK